MQKFNATKKPDIQKSKIINVIIQKLCYLTKTVDFIIMINIVVMIVILRAEIADMVFVMQQIALKDIPLN